MIKAINPCDFEAVAELICKTLVDNKIDSANFAMREVKIGPTITSYDLILKTEKDREKINDKFTDDLSERLFPYEVTVEAVQIYNSQRVRVLIEIGHELCDEC